MKTDARQITVNVDMGIGFGSSATSGDMIVAIRAKRLQMPKAVVVSAVGNIRGVARYDRLKAKAIPNLANNTNTAIKIPSALKKMTIRMPPSDARLKEMTYEILTPNLSITKPEHM